MSTNQNASAPAGLFGDGPGTPVATPNGIGDLIVSKSGESILFTPRDAQGAPLPIAGLRSSDDAQLLQLVGMTQAASCTLTFGAATTAPIPLLPAPPLTSFVWRATLPRAGSYNIGMYWGAFFGLPGPGCSQALLEVFDSGKLIGSTTMDQRGFPGRNSFLDSDIADPAFGVFRQVGVFNFAGTGLEVRISGPPNTGMLMAGPLRVAPVGSTNPADVGFVDTEVNRKPGSNGVLEGSASANVYGNWTFVGMFVDVAGFHGGYWAWPAGSDPSRFVSPPDVAKAMAGLPGVVPGGLTVSAASPQSIALQFSGPMGKQAWPTLSCSEPMIRVVHDGTSGTSIGGDFPTATINGVAHQLRAASFAAGKSRIAFHLLQDAPAVQSQRLGEGLFRALGWFQVQDGVGFGGRAGYATQAGPLVNWQFQGLAGPAEFQVDITWPGPDPAGDLLECAVYDAASNVLATVSNVDQSKAPADSVDAAGVGWKSLGRFQLPLEVNGLTVQARGGGAAGKHTIIDTVRVTRVSADRGAKIRPGDAVLFRMPADYVRTASGSVAAATDVAVTPAPATRLPAPPGVPKAMKLGYNCDWPSYYGNDSCFANMAIQLAQPIGLAQDARGNPVRLDYDQLLQSGSATSLLSIPPGDASGRGYGVPTCGPGVWVVQWAGPPSSWIVLQPQTASTGVAELVARRTTVGTVNRRFYQVTTTSPASPSLQLRFLGTQKNDDGTYHCDVANVAVFPPDVDPDSPSSWRPSFLKKLRGVQCFRFMDMLGTNNLDLSSFAHLPDRANFPLAYGGQRASIPIESIGPPAADLFSESVPGPVVRVKTRVPHGLATGFNVRLRTTDGSSLGQVASNVVDPTTGATTTTPRDPIDPTDGYANQYVSNACHVIDETTFQVGLNCWSGPVSRMTNTLTPANGIVYVEIAAVARMGPADIVDLCSTTGLDPWVNVPWLATDDCVRRMALVLAGGLPKGTTVRVEYGNEPWNYGFPGAGFCIRMARLLGLAGAGYIPYYITRMGQVHQIFRDVWAAQGRDPAEVRRVCGVQQDYAAGSTAPSLEFAIANGISFDELTPATYYNNEPAAGPLDDLLTREQLLDLLAMNLQIADMTGSLGTHLQACRDALARYPAQAWLGDVVLVNYEGGPTNLATATMSANLAARNHGVHRHPDFCEIELYHLQMMEDAGVKLFNIFSLYGTRDSAQWGVYEGQNMEPGTGDATVDVANVDDFENLLAIKSETAGALMKWSAMLQATASPAPAPRPRNGTLLAYGGRAY